MRHPHMAAGRGLYAFEEGASYGVDEASLPDLGELWEKGLDWQRLGPLLRRAARVDQMDFEAALDEMLSLCFCDPQRVFKQAYYRKQTKNAWARDDPAFALLQCGFLAVAAVATGCAVSAARAGTYCYLVAAAAGGHWLAGGLAAATAHAVLANAFLQDRSRGSHSVAQSVEWLYAFDVHCDAFFVYFLVAYVGHYLVLPLALGHSYAAMLLANALHLAATGAYWYVTHLGFRALPFLRRTEVFLSPVLAAAAAFLAALVLGVFGAKLNASRVLLAAVLSPLST